VVRSIIALTLALSVSPSDARTGFDGTWKLEATATHRSATRFEIELHDGVFTCRWCVPVWSVPADGAFHRVEGQRRYDEASVQIISPSSAVFTRRKDGRTYYQAVDTISRDGSLMSFAYMEIVGEGKVETGTGLWSRLATGPSGSHPVSGQWRELWVKSTSEGEVAFTISTIGDAFRIDLAPGETLAATVDGPAEPIQGDARGTKASLRRDGDTALVQTDYRNDEVVSITRYTLLDAATMELIVEDSHNGGTSHYRARRQ
jgi:hypothetical protein